MLKVLLAACGVGHVVMYKTLPLFWYWVAPALVAVLVLACWRAKPWLKVLTVYAVVFSGSAALGVMQLQKMMTDVLPHALDKQRMEVRFEVTRMGHRSLRHQQFEAVLLDGQYNNGQYNNGQYNDGQYNDGQYNDGQYNDGQYNAQYSLVHPHQIDSPYNFRNKKVRLSWYRKRAEPLPDLAVGQQWQAEVTLRRPRGLANPGGFDYAAWLLAQGYNATGYLNAPVANGALKKKGEAQLLATQRIGPLARARQYLSLKLGQLQQERPTSHGGRFFKALLIGAKDELSADDWHILQATGTVHLMAISGLHVGLVAAIGFWLGLALHRFIVWFVAPYRCGAAGLWGYRLLPIILAIGFAGGYALLAGFAIPTRRALIAIVLLNMAWGLGMRFAPSHLLAIALLCVVLSEPQAGLQAGFWLSFAAVALLLLKFQGYHYCQGVAFSELSPVKQRLARWRQRFYLGVAMQWMLSLAMCLPLWILGFAVSGLSPVANIVAVPLVALVFVPGLLLWIPLSFTPLGAPFLQQLSLAFDALWWGLGQLANSPIELLWPSVPLEGLGAIAGGLLLVLACVLILLPRTLALPLGGVSLLVLLAFGGSGGVKNFNFTVLDVGQGLAVVIENPSVETLGVETLGVETPGVENLGIKNTDVELPDVKNSDVKNLGAPALVYDTGATFGERFNAGAHIVAPYLRRLGIKRTAIMVSHGDADHKGGFAPLLKQFNPEQIWSGEVFSGLPRRAQPCYAGQHWRWGEAEYRVLWPLPPKAPQRKDIKGTKALAGNNRSCVLQVQYKGVVFLLPGDIDTSVEQKLLALAVLPRVDVLVAPHHGSQTSSSMAFLQALKPRHIVVSAAFKSRYGHPHTTVLARYQLTGATVWNTAEHGAISFKVMPDGMLQVHAERLMHPKIWYSTL